MTFDDQIRRTFDTLTGRLREEVARQLGGTVAELAAAAQADREAAIAKAVSETRGKAEQEGLGRLTDAVSAAEQRAREAAQLEAAGRLKDAVSAAEQRAREAAEQKAAARLAEAVSTAEQRVREAAEQKAAARLTEAVSAAERRAREAAEQAEQRTRGAAQQSAREAAAAAVASARAELKAADRATGERLVDAIRAIDRARSLSEILDTLASTAGREVARAGILLVRGEQLHGWRFIGFGPTFETAGETKVSLHDAGLVAEAVRAGVAVSSDTSGRRAAPPFAQLPSGREAFAVPIPMGGQVVAVLYADQGPADTEGRASAITWRSALETMARHSARCLEALTAFRTARVLTDRPDVAPAASNDRPDTGAPPTGGRVDAETEEGGESARRYARLLVSEIKLYHGAAVVAGQRERDLATRLADEIARARVLYEQRVAAHLRQGADYFHAELVRTLANGDASLLGQTI